MFYLQKYLVLGISDISTQRGLNELIFMKNNATNFKCEKLPSI